MREINIENLQRCGGEWCFHGDTVERIANDHTQSDSQKAYRLARLGLLGVDLDKAISCTEPFIRTVRHKNGSLTTERIYRLIKYVDGTRPLDAYNGFFIGSGDDSTQDAPYSRQD